MKELILENDKSYLGINHEELFKLLSENKGVSYIGLVRKSTQKKVGKGAGKKAMVKNLVMHEGQLKFYREDKFEDAKAPEKEFLYEQYLANADFIFGCDLTEIEKAQLKFVDSTKIEKFSEGKYTISRSSMEDKNFYEDLVNSKHSKVAKEQGKSAPQLKFSTGERKWGKRLTNALVEHKEQYYLTYYNLDHSKATDTYVWEGQIMDMDSEYFNPWRSAEKKGASNQGLDEGLQIIPNDLKFENVLRIHMDGKKFKVLNG